MPFFSSVVRRIIFRVVPLLLDEESLPLLEEEELSEDDAEECVFGRVGSGMR